MEVALGNLHVIKRIVYKWWRHICYAGAGTSISKILDRGCSSMFVESESLLSVMVNYRADIL